MPEYDALKNRLAGCCESAIHLLEAAEGITTLTDEGISNWKMTCASISDQLSEETMRIAVVGAIKSGKSTFVNTLFSGDYLKRGAGVVTSIVTRVKTGSRLRSVLFLKGWDEINRDIQEASVLLPDHHHESGHLFDIRQEKDRQILNMSLNALAADQLITKDTRSAGSVMLTSYLKGFDRILEWRKANQAEIIFERDDFGRHRDFVGDDALAVYLKDVLLEIDVPGLGKDVEVADCQGSDSPNPLHLAMIQDYLMRAHLSIYVISSRTGLRQADIKFLSILKNMGILDTVGFVINCDFSEHDDLRDLHSGIKKAKEVIALLFPDPQIYTFSALYRLMAQTEADLSRRDRERFQHWHHEAEMVDFAREETNRFKLFLDRKINRERTSILLRNHLERLEIVVGGLDKWISFNQDLLTRDTDGARTLVDRAHHQQAQLEHMKHTLKNTLDGAINHVKGDLKTAVDRFFDRHTDGVVGGIIRFIHGHQVDLNRYNDHLQTDGFAKTLYLVFQEFKQAIDAYMAESINPQVIRFVREQEERLMGYLDEIAGPYGSMIDETFAQTAQKMDADKKKPRPSLSRIRVGTDLESIRNAANLALPPAAATMHYSAQIKTEAVMRFGLYKIANWVKNIFKKAEAREQQEKYAALAAGLKRMKRETERSILFHLKDYQENIKFQYLLKLADAAAEALYRKMCERFQHHGADLSQLMEMVAEDRLDKENLLTELDRLQHSSADLLKTIDTLKMDLSESVA